MPKRPEGGGGAGGAAKGVRLQRVMADAGVASRRECEEMIEGGRVTVNGSMVTELPVFVDPSDRITVDGRPLLRPERSAKKVYVMLNKPDNTLGTTKDDLAYEKGGRRTVTDIVQHPSGARLFPVGRLDFHSTGLVLMTNDGALAERLTHARFGITKTYRVLVNGQVSEEIMDMLRRRVGKRDATDAEGRPTRGVRTVGDEVDRDQHHKPQTRDPNMTILEIQVREGKTEPLGDMLLGCGCRVKKIARTAIGPLQLIGVRPGDWRDLTKDEVHSLMEASGLLEAQQPKPQRPKGAPSDDSSKPSKTAPETPA